jgi:hypothetical protein
MLQKEPVMQPVNPISSDNCERIGRAFGGALGTIFLSLFGLVWILLALAGLKRTNPVAVILLSSFAAALLVLSVRTIRLTRHLVRNPANAARNRRINRLFGLINVVQWAGILLAINLLNHFHLSSWIVPAIIFIVGAHFLPLAYLFGARLYYVTGVALMIWAVAAPQIVPTYFMEPVAALGTGAILWITAMKLTLDSSQGTPKVQELC